MTVILTGRTGIVAAVGALLVLAAGPLAGEIVDGVLVVAVMVDVVLAASPRAVRVHRAGDRQCRAGESATVDVVLRNVGRRRLRATVRDAWPPSAAPTGERHRVDVAPGEQRRLRTALRPTRRGERSADRVTVRSVGPSGLAGRQRSHVAPWSVQVLPAFSSRRYLPERLARLRQLDGLVAAPLRGQGSEFDSLREYVLGDDVRAIDWRATARHGDVVVRTYRPERDRRVVVVLDTGRTSAARVGDAPRLDAAIEAALLLAALARRAGDRVDLLAYDTQVRAAVRSRGADGGLAGFVQALAPLQPRLVETDAEGLVAEVLRRSPRRALVVLFTGMEPAALEAGLLPVLPQLGRSHVLILAAASDPRMSELARGRGDAAAVYAAAAAQRELARRQRISALLHRHGARVVSAGPEELAPAVADAYLALKAAGRL